MWARMSLRFKLTLVVVTAVTVASILGGRFAFSGLLDILERVTGMEAQTAAQVLVDTIGGDWVITATPSDQALDQLRRRSALLVNNKTSRVKQIDILSFLGEQKVRYIVSISESPDKDVAFGSVREMAGEKLLNGQVGYGVVKQQSGRYMGGWVPILSSDRPVGVVVVSIDASDIQRTMDAVFPAIFGTMLAFIVLSGLTAYKFSATFEKTAVTDGLMGIYNHKYFKQRLEEEVAKAKRYGQLTSMVLFDIDFFKRVNDTYGHATGDLVLKLMAKWVTDLCRNTDVICRYGGEEIACILPHTGIAGAQEFAERLRLKISQQVVKDPEEDAEFRVTVSVGVVQWEKGMEMMDMIRGADAALYHSKRTGRNRVTIYHDELLPAPEEMASKPERTKSRH